MKMRMYNPQLAELLTTLDKPPIISTLRTFGAIVDTMRITRDFLTTSNEKFNKLYSDAVKERKLTESGLKDLKADYQDAIIPYRDMVCSLIRKEIQGWKDHELRNAFEVVNKAPSDEKVRQLEVILKRENISGSEIELWAKAFGDNYLCASAFRDFAEKKGFHVIYSDFTDADERIETINKANDYLSEMLNIIDQDDIELSYQAMAFYGTDENGKSYNGSLAARYTELLDHDQTFKPQKIEVKPISKEQVS